MQGVQVRSLVWKLRSHMLGCMRLKKKKKKNPQRHDKIEKGGGLETDDMAK